MPDLIALNVAAPISTGIGAMSQGTADRAPASGVGFGQVLLGSLNADAPVQLPSEGGGRRDPSNDAPSPLLAAMAGAAMIDRSVAPLPVSAQGNAPATAPSPAASVVAPPAAAPPVASPIPGAAVQGTAVPSQPAVAPAANAAAPTTEWSVGAPTSTPVAPAAAMPTAAGPTPVTSESAPAAAPRPIFQMDQASAAPARVAVPAPAPVSAPASSVVLPAGVEALMRGLPTTMTEIRAASGPTELPAAVTAVATQQFLALAAPAGVARPGMAALPAAPAPYTPPAAAPFVPFAVSVAALPTSDATTRAAAPAQTPAAPAVPMMTASPVPSFDAVTVAPAPVPAPAPITPNPTTTPAVGAAPVATVIDRIAPARLAETSATIEIAPAPVQPPSVTGGAIVFESDSESSVEDAGETDEEMDGAGTESTTPLPSHRREMSDDLFALQASRRRRDGTDAPTPVAHTAATTPSFDVSAVAGKVYRDGETVALRAATHTDVPVAPAWRPDPGAVSLMPAGAAPAPSSSRTVDQVAEGLALTLRDGKMDATLTLRPAALGQVKVQITSSRDGLIIRMSADQNSVGELLRARLPELRDTLAAHGVMVAEVHVLPNAAPPTTVPVQAQGDARPADDRPWERRGRRRTPDERERPEDDRDEET